MTPILLCSSFTCRDPWDDNWLMGWSRALSSSHSQLTAVLTLPSRITSEILRMGGGGGGARTSLRRYVDVPPPTRDQLKHPAGVQICRYAMWTGKSKNSWVADYCPDRKWDLGAQHQKEQGSKVKSQPPLANHRGRRSEARDRLLGTALPTPETLKYCPNPWPPPSHWQII